MKAKDLVEKIKNDGLLKSGAMLDELYKVAVENEQKLSEATEQVRQLTEQRDAVVAESVALINSSVCTLQDGCPTHGFYASEWFIAKLKNGEYAALKALPEEYSYDYRTNDGTYYTKDWVVGWMQTPDTEYRPNVETPATSSAIAALRAEGVEMFAKALRIPGDDQFLDAIAVGVAGTADEFARQLRESKGAQS